MNSNPFLGVWELDPTSLRYEHGSPGRQATYTVEPLPDGLRFTLDGQDANGNPLHFVYGGRVDGTEVPLPGMALTLTLNQLDERTIESIAKKDGRVVDRWTRRVTPDGQAMTVTQHGVTPEGREFANSSVYRRKGSNERKRESRR